ncbi:hypothetical protein MMC16_006386 [Acarospora aff. strigata]|nr:hypothetical protein [Acarospora aff. strigata]
MASTAIDPLYHPNANLSEKYSTPTSTAPTPYVSETPRTKGMADDPSNIHNNLYTPRASSSHESDSELKPLFDSTHRKLKPRHIQLIGIGGTIGTALYVQIGRGLLNGGPGSLFLAFTLW